MSQELFKNAEFRYQMMSDRLDQQIDHLMAELRNLSMPDLPGQDDFERVMIEKLNRIRLDFNRQVESCIPKHFGVPVFPDD